MLCVPTLSAGTDPEGMISEARPSPASVAVPSAIVPSENVTVPVGLATPGAPVTKVLRVTTAPDAGAAGVAARKTPALHLPIVKDSEPVPAWLLASPEYRSEE